MLYKFDFVCFKKHAQMTKSKRMDVGSYVRSYLGEKCLTLYKQFYFNFVWF